MHRRGTRVRVGNIAEGKSQKGREEEYKSHLLSLYWSIFRLLSCIPLNSLLWPFHLAFRIWTKKSEIGCTPVFLIQSKDFRLLRHLVPPPGFEPMPPAYRSDALSIKQLRFTIYSYNFHDINITCLRLCHVLHTFRKFRFKQTEKGHDTQKEKKGPAGFEPSISW